MRGSSSWDAISGDTADRVVLAVDYPSKRRRGAVLADLVAMVGPGFRFMQTRLPAAGQVQHPRCDHYVDPWIEDIKREPGEVFAILGFGVGGVYAAAIADGIARWQRMPKIILLDPEYVSCASLGRELRTEINSISSLLSDDEVEGAKKIMASFPSPAVGSVADAAIEAVEVYLEISLAPFERAGLGGTWYEELTAPFISYISWLSAAAQLDPGPAWRCATALVSSTAQSVSGAIGRSIPLEVTHTELLRSDRAAQAVRDLLADKQH